MTTTDDAALLGRLLPPASQPMNRVEACALAMLRRRPNLLHCLVFGKPGDLLILPRLQRSRRAA